VCTELRNAESGRTLAAARSWSLDNGTLCHEVCIFQLIITLFVRYSVHNFSMMLSLKLIYSY